ncbi:MAG: cobalt ECF transporter T component CbiQ [Candidatus Omnitrophica bacterium]|nr:cobalt ECF transporter T component CbiQ [Candidatus Omnitrophota bacterium]
MSKNNNFIERSIMGALSFLKDSVFAEEYAAGGGFLQSLDPRVKAITFLLFIIQVLFARSIPALFFLYGLCLFLALVSRINLGFFLKRTWVFIPLFALFIAIPALFSTFSPGEGLATWDILGTKLTITRQGLAAAVTFIMRVAASVSFAVLLTITTRHIELLKVLRIFKIPQVFVMTLGMCYRYIYLFVSMIEDTYRAIKSRVGVLVHYKSGQNIVAWNIAFLWSRSLKLNEEVYRAMLSRGYEGEARVLDEFKTQVKDWLWLFSVAALYLIILWMT